jgi:hypothetical protein
MANNNPKAKTKSVQAKAFIETALSLGCYEDEAKFNAALGKVAQHEPVATNKPDKDEKINFQRHYQSVEFYPLSQ